MKRTSKAKSGVRGQRLRCFKEEVAVRRVRVTASLHLISIPDTTFESGGHVPELRVGPARGSLPLEPAGDYDRLGRLEDVLLKKPLHEPCRFITVPVAPLAGCLKLGLDDLLEGN